MCLSKRWLGKVLGLLEGVRFKPGFDSRFDMFQRRKSYSCYYGFNLEMSGVIQPKAQIPIFNRNISAKER